MFIGWSERSICGGQFKWPKLFNSLLTKSFLKAVRALSSFLRRPESRNNEGLENPLDSSVRRNDDAEKEFINSL
jgi:hypothetical protein